MHSSFRAWAMPETGISVPSKFALLIIFLLTAPLACTDLSDYDEDQIRSTMNDSLIVTTESWNVQMTLMQEGRARMYIEGSHAINYQAKERKHTTIEGPVYVQLFDSLGSVETEAWSKRAIYLEEDAEFELYDSVRVQTVDDRQLFSEYLKWAQDTDRVTSPNFVTIITPSDSISGRGFDGLTDLSSYTITEPRGRLIVD